MTVHLDMLYALMNTRLLAMKMVDYHNTSS